MPVLMSPPGVQETWPSVHPESDPESDPPAAQQQQQQQHHHRHLDDSLTSLHWLQNFSIINADPERCGHASSSISSSSSSAWSSSSSSWSASPLTSSSQHHHHHHHLQHPQSYPQSPPAGDTAATGMPTHLGSPVTSVSDCGLLNYAHQAHAHQTRHGHLGVVARPLQPPLPLQTPAADVDYKSDPKVKPPYSYASLICMAMQASQRPKVTLSTIYGWITENFCYYRHAEPSWQNSIRHNLSLNKCFVKVPRQKDEPGKGGFWQIDPQYADMFVNGIFKRRRMSTNHYNNNNNNNSSSNSSGGGNAHRHGKLGRDAPYHRIQNGCLYQGGSGGRKPHPPGKSHGGKGARTPKSPLLATEAHCGGGGDVLRGDFDLASVFDDVLGGGCSNFEDLDINTALSSLGCEMEASLQAGRHAARWCGEGELQGGATTTTTTTASANDRQNPPGHHHHHHHPHHHPHLASYGYLELSCGANVEVGHVVGMTSDLHAPHHHQQQQLHQDQMLLQPPPHHHHLQQQQQQFEETSPPLFPEQPTEEEVVILPWDEIKEEAQVIPLSLDQGFGLCEGFFAEMQPWERVEAYL